MTNLDIWIIWIYAAPIDPNQILGISIVTLACLPRSLLQPAPTTPSPQPAHACLLATHCYSLLATLTATACLPRSLPQPSCYTPCYSLLATPLLSCYSQLPQPYSACPRLPACHTLTCLSTHSCSPPPYLPACLSTHSGLTPSSAWRYRDVHPKKSVDWRVEGIIGPIRNQHAHNWSVSPCIHNSHMNLLVTLLVTRQGTILVTLLVILLVTVLVTLLVTLLVVLLVTLLATLLVTLLIVLLVTVLVTLLVTLMVNVNHVHNVFSAAAERLPAHDSSAHDSSAHGSSSAHESSAHESSSALDSSALDSSDHDSSAQLLRALQVKRPHRL